MGVSDAEGIIDRPNILHFTPHLDVIRAEVHLRQAWRRAKLNNFPPLTLTCGYVANYWAELKL